MLLFLILHGLMQLFLVDTNHVENHFVYETEINRQVWSYFDKSICKLIQVGFEKFHQLFCLGHPEPFDECVFRPISPLMPQDDNVEFHLVPRELDIKHGLAVENRLLMKHSSVR
jgi:hypothetical protein